MTSEFTSHNIMLDDGTLTKPEQSWQMRDLPLMQFALRFLRFAFPDGFGDKSIVDLGCLEGGYAVEFARAGFRTLGIEVRRSNFENCQRVKSATNLPRLDFVCDDVRNLEKYGPFDAVFCCGLLYHLDEPRKFMEQVSHACRRVLIVDTHVASDRPNSTFSVSEITKNEGLTGRWFAEFDDEQQRRADRWSSWHNPRSFWPMKRDLIETLRQIGFSMVVEYPIFDSHREATDRVTIVATKE
jgi:SAM-dependent methyltransferase